MLDVSRLNLGKLSVNPEEVDLNELICEAIETFAAQAQDSKCRVSFTRQEKIIGQWDRYRIEQVFINLLTNAFKYGSGTSVEIGLRQQGEKAVITVTDHGIGIAKEDQSRIFEQFERAVRGGNISGLGLGLFISKQIVEAHGGSISVDSQVGQGSTFTVSLPLITTSRMDGGAATRDESKKRESV